MNSLFGKIYEALFYSTPFSDDLFQEGLYGTVGITLLIGSLFMVLLFYYFINRPSFSRWYHWLIIMCIHVAVQYWLAVAIVKPKLSDLNPDYGSEYWTFALYHSGLALVAYIILSFMLRWWSRNCKRTPIPN